MSRRTNGRHHHHHQNQEGSPTTDAAILAADRVLSKESDYRKNIREIQASALLLADKLAHRGEVEAALGCGGENNNEENEEMQRFLTEQRQRLKDLCEGNVRRARGVDSFLKAVKDTRDEILLASEQDENQGADLGESSPIDYERSILDKVRAITENSPGLYGDMYDEEYCREARSRLNEKERKKKKKRGRSSASTVGDDDDDLEIMANTQGPGMGDSDSSLKCPITGMFFEDPVRSKVCNHTFSRAGIEQMLLSKKRKCPIPGCGNANIDRDQLEEDLEMAMKVQRYHRLLSEINARRRAQADEEDMDDDEEDGVGGAGLTVIE